MKKHSLCYALLLLCSCNKAVDQLIQKSILSTSTTTAPQFVNYTIRKGNHYTDGNAYKPIETGSLNFSVQFDSSAMYKSVTEENQYDINKLYGFSDNNADHHQYSARFGWRWSDGALRLFAYVYNEGEMTSEEITTVPIGQTINCSIKVAASQYIFTCGDRVVSMPRKSATPQAKGYQLYPYFGGDEVAPHDITISIKDL